MGTGVDDDIITTDKLFKHQHFRFAPPAHMGAHPCR